MRPREGPRTGAPLLTVVVTGAQIATGLGGAASRMEEASSREHGTVDLVCRECGAQLRIEPELRTAICPYCASPSVVERPPTRDRPNPTFALGFSVTRDAAVAEVRRWIRKRALFARRGVRQAKIEGLRGLYVPAYLYTVEAHSSYTASIGENYTETYTTTDAKGRTVVRTRTRTEWRALSGAHAAFVPDVVVTASKGIPNAELEAIEPFDLRLLRRYDPALVAGWIAEEPSLDRESCLAAARQETMGRVAALLKAFLPGDSHRELNFHTEFYNEDAALVLAPVWALAVRYDAKRPPFRLLVNGQTGKVGGRMPRSWVKIALAVALGLGLAVLAWLGLSGGLG